MGFALCVGIGVGVGEGEGVGEVFGVGVGVGEGVGVGLLRAGTLLSFELLLIELPFAVQIAYNVILLAELYV